MLGSNAGWFAWHIVPEGEIHLSSVSHTAALYGLLIGHTTGSSEVTRSQIYISRTCKVTRSDWTEKLDGGHGLINPGGSRIVLS